LQKDKEYEKIAFEGKAYLVEYKKWKEYRFNIFKLGKDYS